MVDESVSYMFVMPLASCPPFNTTVYMSSLGTQSTLSNKSLFLLIPHLTFMIQKVFELYSVKVLILRQKLRYLTVTFYI